MVNRTSIKVEGLSELLAGMDEFAPATGKAVLRRVGLAALTPMRDLARSLAPDDPTTPPLDLHTSIEVSTRQKSGRGASRSKEGAASVTVNMGPTKEGYPAAMPQEFGSVKMAPRPFMRPAFDREAEPTIRRVAALLGDEIVKVAKRIAKRKARAAG